MVSHFRENEQYKIIYNLRYAQTPPPTHLAGHPARSISGDAGPRQNWVPMGLKHSGDVSGSRVMRGMTGRG